MNRLKAYIISGIDLINKFSVFHQFHGRFGPTAIGVTNSNHIITALFEFNSLSETGCIGVLNQEGELLQKIKLPQCGP